MDLTSGSLDLSGISFQEEEVRTEEEFKVCQICEYKTKYLSNLKRHCKIHEETQPATSTPKRRAPSVSQAQLICDQCGKEFKTRYGLSLHVKKHTNTFKHNCQICGKGYNQTTQFRFHCAMHQNLVPTKCPHCKDDFTGHSSLKRHSKHCIANPDATRIPTSNFSCNECNKTFTSKDSLTTHNRGKHGPQRYVCEKCGKSFSWRSSLRVHKSTCEYQ